MPAKTIVMGMVHGVLNPINVRKAVKIKIDTVIVLLIAFLYSNNAALTKKPTAIGCRN